MIERNKRARVPNGVWAIAVGLALAGGPAALAAPGDPLGGDDTGCAPTTMAGLGCAKKVESLDELANEIDRDRSYLLNEAVEHYLRLNEHHIKLIKKGLRAAERGDFVPDAEMKKLMARMRRAK